MNKHDEFIKAGYRVFTGNNLGKNVRKLYEKKFFDDNRNIRYMIHIEEYDFSDKLFKDMPEGAKENYRYEYKVQLTAKEGGTMNIDMFSSGWDSKKVEEHVEKIFQLGLFSNYD